FYLATPAGFEPATYSLEGCRSHPLSYGAVEHSMRPVLRPAPLEIVGIGFLLHPLRRVGQHLVINAIALGICDCCFPTVEDKTHLLLGVIRRQPAHQRLRRRWRLGLEFEKPCIVALAGLHRIAGRLVDSCSHGGLPRSVDTGSQPGKWSGWPDSN